MSSYNTWHVLKHGGTSIGTGKSSEYNKKNCRHLGTSISARHSANSAWYNANCAWHVYLQNPNCDQSFIDFMPGTMPGTNAGVNASVSANISAYLYCACAPNFKTKLGLYLKHFFLCQHVPGLQNPNVYV